MSDRKLPELKLFPAMFKYECLVRLLAYVFMAVWYHYGIVMNVCWIMWDSVGDTNGFKFCNCHAVVRKGRKLTYLPALTHLSSGLSPLCGSRLLEGGGGVGRGGSALSTHRDGCEKPNTRHIMELPDLAFGFVLLWMKNTVVHIFFPFLILNAYL